MRLKGKLISGFVTITLVFLVVFSILMFTIVDIKAKIITLHDSAVKDSILSLQLQHDVIQIQQWLTDVSATRALPNYDDGFSKAQAYYQKTQEKMGQLAGFFSQIQGDAFIAKLKADLKKYYEQGIEMANAYIKSGAEKGNLMMSEFDLYAQTITGEINKVVAAAQDRLSTYQKKLTDDITTASTVSTFLLLISILLAIIIALRLSSKISRQLTGIVASSQKLSQGQLYYKAIIHSQDEVGEVAANLNNSLADLSLLIQEIKSISIKNNQTGNVLSRSLEKNFMLISNMYQHIEALSARFEEVINNINSSTSSVEEIFRTTLQLAEQIENQASAISESSASIEEMNASIENVSRITQVRKQETVNLQNITAQGGEKVKATHTIISEISRNVDDMVEMIRIINNVSARTNLLAMNAAIEAAHAGDYGKGFAVVADEIRQLAESTRQNAKKISSSLKEIIEKIKSGQKSSDESGDAFSKINDQVKEVINTFEEIVLSASELSNGSREILSATSSLLTITEEIKNGSVEMTTGAEEINNSMQNVKDISQEYKEKLVDIKQIAAEMHASIVNFSHYIIENNKNAQVLLKKSKQFITNAEELATQQTSQDETFDFAVARLMHLNWLVVMNDFVNDKITLADESIVDHTQCEFGKWLANDAKTKFADNALLTELDRQHRLLHEKIKEVVLCKRNGDLNKLQQHLTALNGISHALLEALAGFEKTLATLN